MNRKEENRLKNTIRNSSLHEIDSGLKVGEAPFGEFMSCAVKSCNSRTQTILEILMSSATYKREFLLDKVDSGAAEVISKVGQECAKDFEIMDHVVFRTVLGAVEHIPFRSLIYLLPAIKMVEAIIEKQEKLRADKIYIPQIEYILMYDIGVTLNELDRDICLKQTELFVKTAKKFLKVYHQKAYGAVKFLIDKTFSSGIRKNREYQDFELKVSDVLKNTPLIGGSLKEMGERRGHADKSFEYAAMHPLLHDGLIDPIIASFDEYDGSVYSTASNTKFIVSIGARPEEEFWKMRKLVNAFFEELSFVTIVPVIQYITNMNVPPYSPLKSGELYLDEVINAPHLLLEARNKGYGEWSNYQIPVQKGVEVLIRDTYRDETELVNFMRRIVA